MNFIEAIQKKKKKLRKDESFWLIFRPGGFKVHVPYTYYILYYWKLNVLEKYHLSKLNPLDVGNIQAWCIAMSNVIQTNNFLSHVNIIFMSL